MDEKVVRNIGAFTITKEVLPDHYADLDWLGTYSDTPNEYAIETGRSGRYAKFFNPPFENYAGCSEDEIRGYCQQDFERMESYGGSWTMVVFRCTITFNGIELGSGALAGIENEWSGENEWHKECWSDVRFMAFENARANIAALRKILC